MICAKGNHECPDKIIEMHHIIPSHLNPKASEVLYLCKSHHRTGTNALHKQMPKTLVSDEEFINFTKAWLNDKQYEPSSWLPICQKCNRRMMIFRIWRDSITLKCVDCGKEIHSQELYCLFERTQKIEHDEEQRKLWGGDKYDGIESHTDTDS